MNNLLKDKAGFKTSLLFYEPIFKSSMKKWIIKYVNEPDNLFEKKYRIIFMKLWLSHKRLDLDNISDQFFEHFENVSSELVKKGLSKYPLDMLFNKYTESKSKEYFGEQINANFFINEDKNDPEKVEIAKKVYQEYADIGIAGKQFLNNNACDGLLMLQDYKFTSTDYVLIENYINQPPIGDFGLFSDSLIIVSEIEKILPKIIEAENDPSKLQILHNYCNYLLTNKEIIDNSTIKSIESTIKRKIDYIDLKSEIDIKEDLNQETPQRVKRNKI
jgi:hypothetical protein